MITIIGAGDHDPPEWLITMAGIRNRGTSLSNAAMHRIFDLGQRARER
jgi:hypothetical protein